MRRGAKIEDLPKLQSLEKTAEYEAMRLSFYKYRYKSHQDSLEFSVKHLTEV